MPWCLIPSYFDYAEKHNTNQTKYQLFLEFQAFWISNRCISMIHLAYSSFIFTFYSDSSYFYDRFQYLFIKLFGRIVADKWCFFVHEAWFRIHIYNCAECFESNSCRVCLWRAWWQKLSLTKYILMMRSLRRSMPFHLKFTPFT